MSIELDKVTVSLDRLNCSVCGLTYAANSQWVKNRREDHLDFCCPNGHSQYFGGKSDVEKARDEAERLRNQVVYERSRNDQLRADRDAIGRRLSAQKSATTRVKKRVANGVCPCCSRYFSCLHRHMKTMHPEFTGEKE